MSFFAQQQRKSTKTYIKYAEPFVKESRSIKTLPVQLPGYQCQHQRLEQEKQTGLHRKQSKCFLVVEDQRRHGQSRYQQYNGRRCMAIKNEYCIHQGKQCGKRV